jgi:hypothetical protein
MSVAGAATKVAFDAVSDFFAGWLRICSQQLHTGHDHAGSAVTALEAMTFPEAFLHPVQLPVFGEAFDRGDLRAIGLDGEDGARLHRFAILQDGAGAADARLATDVRAGEFAVIAQEMYEQGARLDLVLLFHSIDFDSNQTFHTAPPKNAGVFVLGSLIQKTAD